MCVCERERERERERAAHSCLTLCSPMDCNPPRSSVHGDSQGKNTGMGCYALLQGIFPTQGLNPGLLPCRQILYHVSPQGSPRKKIYLSKTMIRAKFEVTIIPFLAFFLLSVLFFDCLLVPPSGGTVYMLVSDKMCRKEN